MRCCISGRRSGGAYELLGSHPSRSEEHTSELQSHSDLVCRLLLEKKNGSLNVTVTWLRLVTGPGGGETPATVGGVKSGSIPVSQAPTKRSLLLRPALNSGLATTLS